MLKQRIITAIVLVLIIVGALLGLSYVLFQAFMVGVLAIAAWEWSSLARIDKTFPKILYTVFISIGITLGSTFADDFLPVILIFNLVCWVIILGFICFYPKYSSLWENSFFVGLSGFLLLYSCFLAVMYLRGQTQFVFHILMLFAVVAAADIGAYFVGRAFGKRKLAPRVSPNKTWEGLWGGMLACCLLVFAANAYTALGISPSWLGLIVSAVLLAAFSVTGDLLESMLKRIRGIKDSGTILPGHGGVLDRIDGLIATAPLYAFLLLNFGNAA